jgi:hypothetical protein
MVDTGPTGVGDGTMVGASVGVSVGVASGVAVGLTSMTGRNVLVAAIVAVASITAAVGLPPVESAAGPGSVSLDVQAAKHAPARRKMKT